MSAPEDWVIRVIEALMQVKKSYTWQSVVDDEIVSQVLLQMRVGEFQQFNMNGVKRYNRNLFRCHVCNAVLRQDEKNNPPDTRLHIELHRQQIRNVLNPDCVYTEDWTGTSTPSIEEVTFTDRDLEMEEHIKRKGIERGLGLNIRTR